MDTKKLLYEELTYKVRGCLFKVYNTLGFGHKEGVYEQALILEFRQQGINFDTEKTLGVFYRSKKVGNYRPDFVIEGKILVEIKAQDLLLKNNELQLLHYLKGTNYQLGLLVNFGSRKLYIRRMIWSTDYQRKSAMISENQSI